MFSSNFYVLWHFSGFGRLSCILTIIILSLSYICMLFAMHCRLVEVSRNESHHVCVGSSMAWHVCAILSDQPLNGVTK